jgi:hypothetical protein
VRHHDDEISTFFRHLLVRVNLYRAGRAPIPTRAAEGGQASRHERSPAASRVEVRRMEPSLDLSQ